MAMRHLFMSICEGVVTVDNLTEQDSITLGYERQLAATRASLPLLGDIRFQAKREKRTIVARVLLADDTIATVSAGPRGGLRILANM